LSSVSNCTVDVLFIAVTVSLVVLSAQEQTPDASLTFVTHCLQSILLMSESGQVQSCENNAQRTNAVRNVHIFVHLTCLIINVPDDVSAFWRLARRWFPVLSYSGRVDQLLFSERELTFTFAICYRPSVSRL